MDVHAAGVTRSFSIANLPGDSSVELIIRRYPDGQLSSRLGSEIVAGSELRLTGPYGTLHLRRPERPIVMIAGGSGIGPVLALLRQLAADGGAGRARLYFAAREPFLLDELRDLGCPATLFDRGSLAEVVGVDRDAEVYMCGPPGLLDDAEAVVTGAGVDPARIHADRFTTAASAAEGVGGDGVRAASEREFAWFAPAGRRATLYEDVTIDTQPSIHRHLARGWPLSFADGRGTWNDASTALRSTDWFAFRDPGQQWERTFYQAGAAVERQLESALASAAEQGLISDFAPDWVAFLRTSLQIPAFVEHGLWFALATAARDCLSDSVATCVCLQAAHKQRSAQAIVLYAMDLEAHLGCELPIAAARDAFLHDPAWQPTRRYLERLAATADWGEVIVAANLCFEPVVGTLIRRELGTRAAAASGDTVTPVLARVATQEWEWARAWTVALVRFLVSDEAHGTHNRAVIDGWLKDWMAPALQAAAAVSDAAGQVSDYAAAHRAATRCGRRPTQTTNSAGGAARGGRRAASAGPRREPSTDGSHDHVGIVMAKSAEGDAVARFFAGRAEVIEQPAFWEIRAAHRSGHSLRGGVRGARLRHRRLFDPARDVDALWPHGGHRRRPDAVLRSHRGDGAPAVMKRRLARWLARRDRGRVAHALILAALPRAIAQRFDAAAADGLDATLELAIRHDSRPASYALAIAGARCSVRSGAPAQANARADNRRRRSHPSGRRGGDMAATALQRPLQLTGDPFLALRFASLPSGLPAWSPFGAR